MGVAAAGCGKLQAGHTSEGGVEGVCSERVPKRLQVGVPVGDGVRGAANPVIRRLVYGEPA